MASVLIMNPSKPKKKKATKKVAKKTAKKSVKKAIKTSTRKKPMARKKRASLAQRRAWAKNIKKAQMARKRSLRKNPGTTRTAKATRNRMATAQAKRQKIRPTLYRSKTGQLYAPRLGRNAVVKRRMRINPKGGLMDKLFNSTILWNGVSACAGFVIGRHVNNLMDKIPMVSKLGKFKGLLHVTLGSLLASKANSQKAKMALYGVVASGIYDVASNFAPSIAPAVSIASTPGVNSVGAGYSAIKNLGADSSVVSSLGADVSVMENLSGSMYADTM